MAANLSFSEFRSRLELRGNGPSNTDSQATGGTCRWVSDKGLYCFGEKPQEDNEELLSFFSDHPSTYKLRDFPEHLCDVAFCNLHASLAKPHCHDSDVDSGKATAVIRVRNSSSEKDMVLWRDSFPRPVQWLQLGDGDSMRFVLGQPLKEDKEGERELQIIRNDETRTVSLHFCEGYKRKRAQTMPTVGSRAGRYVDMDSEDMYPKDQSDVMEAEEELISLMQQDIEAHNATPGYVYALRDPAIKLVKIGCCKQFVTTGLGEINYTCNTEQPLALIAGEHLAPLPAYEVLGQLIKVYLRPHRWYFNCDCDGKDGIHNGEYFDISDDVVKDVFDTWRSFMLQRPYTSPTLPTVWNLRPEWSVRLKTRESPWRLEKHEHHVLKLGRWKKLLLDPTMQTSDMEQASRSSRSVGAAMAGTGRPISRLLEGERRRSVSAVGSNRHSLASSASLNNRHIDRHRPISTMDSNRQSLSSSSGLTNKLHEALLGVPAISFNQTRSAPSTPPRQRSASGTDVAGALSRIVETFGHASDAPTQMATAGNTTAREVSERSNIPQVTIAPEERTMSRSIQKSKLRDAFVPSSPVDQFTFTASPSDQHEAPQSTKDVAIQVDFKDVSPSAEPESVVQKQSLPTEIDATNPEPQLKIDWMAKYMELEAALRAKREGLPPRTILEDLIQFRWPLAFALCLGTYSSYVPSLLAFATWMIFLPCLVAELRGWFPELDRRKS